MKDISEINWFHCIPYGNGRITPGTSHGAQLEHPYQFDDLNFNGKAVLDLGANDGYFSFMAEQRGARQVVAVEAFSFEGFECMQRVLKSSVMLIKQNIFNINLPRIFDIVLCYGVYYHVSDPVRLLNKAFSMAKHEILFEGESFDSEEPCLKLLPIGYCNDKSNVFAASTPFMTKVAESNGFQLLSARNVAPNRKSWRFYRHTEAEQPKHIEAVFPE